MKIHGFHRGLNNWVAEFEYGGRMRVAYLDRNLGRWFWAHQDDLDVSTITEMEIELTNELKTYLEKIGVITKGESNG